MPLPIKPPVKCATPDPAQRSRVKLRALCNALATEWGMRHDEIATAIGTKPRSLSAWKTERTIPHWAIDQLELLLADKQQKTGTK